MICKTIIILVISSSVLCAPTNVTEQEVAPIFKAQPERASSIFGCARSQYSCKTSPFQSRVCIGLEKLCDGVKDCPSGEDETNDLCVPKELLENLKKASKDGVQNDFAGTGFMFSVNNLIVSGGSRVKLFNQNSDNIADPNSNQTIVSNGGQQN